MNKPNIIYILADDMGYGDVAHLNENCKFPTPHLDQLCQQGMYFSDAHSTSAVCTPSRYGILTGRYNWRSRLKSGVIGGYTPHLIEDDRKTVAHLLSENGYYTACIGKWHLGMDWGCNGEFNHVPDFGVVDTVDYTKPIQFGPTYFGFDYYYGISASLDMPPYVYIENDSVPVLPDHETVGTGKGFWRKGPTAPDFVHEDVLPTLTKKVLDTIENHKDDPFFIYFPLPAPHTPILPTKEWQGKSGINEYADFVMMCDDMVGQVVAQLEKHGLSDNTIVIFTADNGCSPMANFQELAEKGHNPSYVFRGHKADIFEGGHRIPYIVKWPATIAAGTQSDEPVCLVDLMGTMANIIDTTLPDTMGEDTVSQLPIWQGGTEYDRDALIHQSIDGSLSIRKGKFKLEMCSGSGGWSAPTPNSEVAKALPPIQLYDLETDISEQHNIFDQHPEVVKELTDILVAHIKNGRSTPGTPQENNGVAIWSTINWLNDYNA